VIDTCTDNARRPALRRGDWRVKEPPMVATDLGDLRVGKPSGHRPPLSMSRVMRSGTYLGWLASGRNYGGVDEVIDGACRSLCGRAPPSWSMRQESGGCTGDERTQDGQAGLEVGKNGPVHS
jgi:hypothetical protein